MAHLVNIQTQPMYRAFKPSWPMIILTVIAVSLFCRLGIWQYQRGLEKARLIKQHQAQKLTAYAPSLQLHTGMQLKLKGRFDNTHQFLLDNQFYRHQVGFDVLTPFLLDSGEWVLVDRGFVKAPNRQFRPKLTPIATTQQIKVTVYFPSSKARVLGDVVETKSDWPKVIEKVDTALLGRVLGQPLLPMTMRLQSREAHGFIRDWPVVSFPPARHYAYAMQWFSFAAIALFLFFYLNRGTVNEKK